MKNFIARQIFTNIGPLAFLPLTRTSTSVVFSYYGSDSLKETYLKNLIGKYNFELNIKKLNYGQNKRSSEHIGMFGNKPFSTDDHKNFLQHEKIDNLVGLEIELVYEWELGSMLIFDRTNLHCSSSKIEGKKIGLTTFTKR